MCEVCGVHYSFVFGVQYHKADCPTVTKSETESDKAIRVELARK